ncbi:MAG: D-2-hydroxyacid dehydrogenase [Verrucomicrobia bacterium]|nr:D-2-hydroxyacid dehydrogenase [Verrucomicrobiota bacterium]
MKILIDLAPYPAGLAALQRLSGVEVECVETPAVQARPLPVATLRDVEVLFCTIPPSNHAEMTALRWIQIASAGYVQLFGLDLPQRGIAATNALGCFDVPIAEWNLAMMVNLLRDFRQMIRNQDGAIWDRSARFQRELRGLTVGIWGYGGIGRETARLARAFGMRVHVLTRTGKIPLREETYCVPGTGDPDGSCADRVFGPEEEKAFLGGLDFLVLAMPLTPRTEGLLGEAQLRALPPHSFLLNPARGPILQQAALLRALGEKWIAGAALDTHYHYPMPPEHPLWRFPNVIFTPHISGSSLSPRFEARLWDIFVQNVDRHQRGARLLNLLTPAQLNGN